MTIDDQLRTALHAAIPEPKVDASAVTRQIVDRWAHADAGGGPHDADAGGGPHHPGTGWFGGGRPSWFPGGPSAVGPSAFLPVVIGAIAGLLVGGGVALGATAGGGSPAPALQAVPVAACPSDATVGSLRDGDRVFIVGRAPGQVAVRNIRGDGDIVFIDSEYVQPDADLSELPELSCDTVGALAVAEPSPSSEPSTSPQPSPSTAPEPEPGPAPKPKPKPEPEPGDTTKPVIQNGASEHGTVFDPAFCTSPYQSAISAHVTDDTGVASVKASWTIQGTPTTKTMADAGGGNYTATFGPIAAGTMGPHQTENVTVTITAKDAAGNTATNSSVHVTVTSDGGGCLY